MRDETRLPIVEEQVVIDKETRATGTVRVSTKVDTEHLVASDTLVRHSADVERVPVGREVAEVPQVREEDGVLVIPVVEERLVIEKRLFLIEELRVRRERIEVPVEIPVTRRVMSASVEREDIAPSDAKQQ